MLSLLLLAAGQAVQAFPSPLDVGDLNLYRREVPNDTVTIPARKQFDTSNDISGLILPI